MSHNDISRASRLPKTTVAELSFKRSWEGVPVDIAVRFAIACGVNHLNCRRQLQFFRRKKHTYIYNGDGNQRRLYARLLAALKEWAKSGPNGEASSVHLTPAA